MAGDVPKIVPNACQATANCTQRHPSAKVELLGESRDHAGKRAALRTKSHVLYH